jgi:DNA invertase Pin-like site-specific DNA recombinase
MRALVRSCAKAALAVKKARGERVGGVPYGYHAGPDGRLVADAAETATVERARTLRREGLSLRRIRDALAAEGHQPRAGAVWAGPGGIGAR